MRSYVELRRRSHGAGGAVGEYIVPSGPLPERERRLYADLERMDDGSLIWNAPRSWKEGSPDHPFLSHVPAALRLVRAMQNLGLFSKAGLKTVSDVWGAETLGDAMSWQEAKNVIWAMLESLDAKGGIPADATENDVCQLLNDWPFPMWDFDLSAVVVPIEELEAERDRSLSSLMGS